MIYGNIFAFCTAILFLAPLYAPDKSDFESERVVGTPGVPRTLKGSYKSSNFSKAFISFIIFDDVDLTESNFDGAEINATRFLNAQLDHARFDRAFISNSSFAKANLTNANFANTVIMNVEFNKSNLTHADFSNALFYNPIPLGPTANFTKANLTNAKFIGANISGQTSYPGQYLPIKSAQTLGRMVTYPMRLIAGGNQTSANFTGAILKNVDFSKSTLKNIDFSNLDLTGTQFVSADIGEDKGLVSTTPGVTFVGTNLTNADFSNANVRGIDFSKAILTGANFTNADICGAQFTSAKDAELSRAKKCHAKSGWFGR